MQKFFLAFGIAVSLFFASRASAQTSTSAIVTVKELRARTSPYTTSPSVVSIYLGEKVSVVEVVTGQMVEGNSTWYKTKSGYYVWSGGTAGGVSLPSVASTVANVATGNTTASNAASPFIVQNGNVGLGKNPSYKFDVNGTVNSSQYCINGNCINAWPSGGTTVTNTGGGPSSWVQSGNTLSYPSGNLITLNNDTNIKFLPASGSSSSGAAGYLHYSTADNMQLWSGRSVQLFAVDSVQLFGGNQNTNPNLFVSSNGKVGIGTSNPVSKIHVYGDQEIPDTQTGTLISSARIQLQTPAANWFLNAWHNTNRFSIGRVSTADDFTIDPNGNVGIGITLPTEKLDVTGNIKASGGYSSNGQQGLTRTINLSTGSPCSITITGGLITSTTCQ